MNEYLDQKLLAADPFRTIDRDGVALLIKMSVEKGRVVRPDLKIGICGEQGETRLPSISATRRA